MRESRSTMHDSWYVDHDLPLIGFLAEVKDAVSDELYGQLHERGYGDIRPAHGCVFGFIERTGGARLTALADRSGLTKQAVGEAVADLEGLGYVERVPDPGDGRAKIIRLSPLGREAAAAAEEIFADIERRFADEVGEERFEEFRDTLRRLFLLTRMPGWTPVRVA
jgi:DNA-binding MarR family transcriptional regulator